MALKPCRECNKKVSTEALTCPNCGVPNPTLKTKTKSKIKSIGSNEVYARCEKIFCKIKYEIIIIPRTALGSRACSRCGNELNEVSHKDAVNDIARKETQKDIIQNKVYETSKPKGKYFFNGTKSLGITFWGYFLGGNAVFQIWAFLLISNRGDNDAIYLITSMHIVWNILAIMGVFNSADIYKAKKIKQGLDYPLATASKVACIVLALSALGRIISS